MDSHTGERDIKETKKIPLPYFQPLYYCPFFQVFNFTTQDLNKLWIRVMAFSPTRFDGTVLA